MDPKSKKTKFYTVTKSYINPEQREIILITEYPERMKVLCEGEEIIPVEGCFPLPERDSRITLITPFIVEEEMRLQIDGSIFILFIFEEPKKAIHTCEVPALVILLIIILVVILYLITVH
jgi:hypothetical protein